MIDKVCRVCEQTKDAADFYKHPDGKSGLHPWCKECVKKDIRIRKERDPDHVREINNRATKKWKNNNRQKFRQSTERWRKRNPELMFFYSYGISHEEFKSMLNLQDNKCAICSSPFSGRCDQRVDHNHSCCNKRGKKLCGKCIRGILCNNCNTAIGMLKDDPKLCDLAAAYLRGYDSGY